MNLRDYQQEVHDDCMAYLKRDAYKGPAVINASVGAGKSVLIAAIAKHCASVNIKGRQCRALIIQRQGELCKQNSDAAFEFGVTQQCCYSASLGRKGTAYPIIFGTEGTVYNALQDDFIADPVDIIMIDECHMCDFEKPETQFMKIISHFLRLNPNTRILGYTGSPYRGTETIIGPFWRQLIGNISTDWLIEKGWLVPPTFGWPDGDDLEFDFSELQPKYGSWEYDENQMNDIVFGDPTKTQRIMAEVVHRTQDRGGVLIFCTSVKHTEEVARSLPYGSYCIITGSTPQPERMAMLDDCKSGKIKYCINVSVLTTGVNVPAWDTVVFLRPIGSLVLLTQAIGRGLRLHEGKTDCLVLDYGGVMDRIGHLYNSPMLDDAEYERAKKKEEDMIDCPICGTENSKHARRCRGESSESEDGRCEFFFLWRDCPSCGAQNDPTARNCRKCDGELIDPNEKLLHKPYADQEWTPVSGMTFRKCRNNAIEVEYYLTNGEESPKLYFQPWIKDHKVRQPFKQWLSMHGVTKERELNSGVSVGTGISWGTIDRVNDASAVSDMFIKYHLPKARIPSAIKHRKSGKRWIVGQVKID